VLTLYGEYEAEALVAEATAFLEQASAEGTKSEVD
jgi:hypothetical protein